MALSYERTVAGGGTKIIQVPFAYLEKEHVRIYLEDVEQTITEDMWISDTAVELADFVPAGVFQLAKRDTPKLHPLVTFVKGNFDELDLNRVILQQLYITQEAFDAADLLIASNIGESVEQARAAAAQALLYLTQLIQVRNDIINADGPVSIVAADLGNTGFSYDLGSVADPVDDGGATPPGNIRTVANNMAAIIAAVAILDYTAELLALAPVAGYLDEAAALAPYTSQLVALAPRAADIATLAPQAANIQTLAAISTALSTLAAIAADISYVAANGVPPDGSVTSAKIATAGIDFGSAS